MTRNDRLGRVKETRYDICQIVEDAAHLAPKTSNDEQ